jgi:hypothetical protein
VPYVAAIFRRARPGRAMAETTIREVVLKGVNASSKIASTFFLDKELLSVYYLHWKSVRPCIPARQHPCWRFCFSDAKKKLLIGETAILA